MGDSREGGRGWKDGMRGNFEKKKVLVCVEFSSSCVFKFTTSQNPLHPPKSNETMRNDQTGLYLFLRFLRFLHFLHFLHFPPLGCPLQPSPLHIPALHVRPADLERAHM